MTGKKSKGFFDGLHKKPKSKKEWQEWNRKYALAFLNDQLDRVMDTPIKKNYVLSLFNKWEKKFRKERSDEIIRDILCLEEKRSSEKACRELRENHINFIAEYIACALCDGIGKENIAGIRNFLAMQTATNIKDRMELCFWGGTPLVFSIYVDSLRDVDIADVYFVSEFRNMFVYRQKRKNWTKSIAQRFVEELKRDVLYDYPGASVKPALDYENLIGYRELEIEIEIPEEELDLKNYQCFPPSFIERFHQP